MNQIFIQFARGDKSAMKCNRQTMLLGHITALGLAGCLAYSLPRYILLCAVDSYLKPGKAKLVPKRHARVP